MKRRNFLKTAGVVAGAAAATSTAQAQDGKVYEWKMVTTWPKNFPGLGVGANFLAKKIDELTNGQVKVTVYGAGELVPAFESFDAVSNGTAQMGHGSAYYWKGKAPAVQFFAAVPYGLTATEMNSWLYQGGGLELWKEVYAPFNLVPAAAGNTGVQMAGWFNKKIDSVEDLKGLKMRIPGLGGEVLKRLGGTPISLPGGEIFTSLQSGAIDATEWVGPYNDLAFGFYKAAKYYYYPGWHEPGTTLETFINKDALAELPAHLQEAVLSAARVANQDMLADYNARNGTALSELVNKHGVKLMKLPDSVLLAIRDVADSVVAEVASQDAMSKKVYDSYLDFREKAIAYAEISERAYLNARALK